VSEHEDRRLGEILVARGALTRAGLAAALAEQEGNDRLFGEILVALGLVSSSAVADALAEQRGWPTRASVGTDGGLVTPTPEPTAAPPQLEPAPPPPSQLPPLSVVRPPVHVEPETLEAELAAAHAEVATLQSALAALQSEAERLRRELALRPPQAADPEEDSHLAFVPTASGYRLFERPGPAPGLGEHVEVSLDEEVRASFVVAKRAPGPIPGGPRCAYLQRL
jgi:hypothetical protein